MIRVQEDVSSVFEKMTVKEIQDYERKTRAEIERRKEDLRVMVGERYRDLIEAADTIGDMKISVENVLAHVSKMCEVNNMITRQKPIYPPVKPIQPLISPLLQTYSTAAQVKLFLDIPDKIWTSLESGDLLQSASLFLLAQHLRSSIEFEVEQAAHTYTMSATFPVVARQWASIIHFRASILQHCQEKVKSIGLDYQAMTECLCAILCITNSTPRKLCSDFLLWRMTSLEDILSPNHQASNVKDQINSVLVLIKETLCMTYCIFHDEPGNSLMDILDSLKSIKHDDLLRLAVPSGASWTKYLPSSLKDFRPAILTVSNNVSIDFLQETCNHWIRVARDTVTSGVTQMLSYINSIKNLSTIQEALVETLIKINEDDIWLKACKVLIQKDIDIWEEFLSPLFSSRIKGIIHTQLKGTLQLTEQSILSAANDVKLERSGDFEKDVSSFIWTEEAGDLPSKFVWGYSPNNENICNLTMKAKGFTPKVQGICLNLNNQLKAVLEDVGHYAKSSNEHSPKVFSNAAQELASISTNLQSAFCDLVHDLMKYMSSLRDSDNGIISRNVSVTKALLLARIYAGIAELCPNFKKAISKDTYFSKPSQGRTANNSAEDQLWQSVTKELSDEKLALYRFWKASLCDDIKPKVRALIPTEVADIFGHIPQWDLIQIEEEGEAGETVQSKISVPMHPSWQMESLLYWICWQINEVGGHIIPRCVLSELHQELLNQILVTYEEYFKIVQNEKQLMPQKSSLQHLFNIRFISGLIAQKDNQELSDRIQAICDQLEGFVDPFDLDVFSPYIGSHLKRCIQRSLVLLGPITSSDRIAPLGSTRQQLSQQDQHNVLNLCSGGRVRFTLLPVGPGSAKSFSERESLDSAKSEPKSKTAATKNDKARTISPERTFAAQSSGIAKSASSSFFGAMSSSWFRN